MCGPGARAGDPLPFGDRRIGYTRSMPSFMPPLATLIPFMVAALTLNLTPGADMTYVIARSVGQGRAAGVVSALGVSAGSLGHSILAAIGLSALVLQSETAFQIIKFAGAGY